jgi:hypothetical protein
MSYFVLCDSLKRGVQILSIPKAIKTKNGINVNPREAFRCSPGTSFLSADFQSVKEKIIIHLFIKLEIRVAALLRRDK